jgi:hypothetical protein
MIFAHSEEKTDATRFSRVTLATSFTHRSLRIGSQDVELAFRS